MPYETTIREEELKNRVAADLFPSFDCTRILGAVDFCVQPKTSGPTLWETESLLWAEAKNGARADFAPLFAQLVLTVGGPSVGFRLTFHVDSAGTPTTPIFPKIKKALDGEMQET